MTNILRSSLWTVFVFLVIGIYMLSRDLEGIGWVSSLANGVLIIALVLIAVGVVLLNLVNRKKPENKGQHGGYLPTEFREEDEGMKWLTYNASRKVYIFFYYALPLSILLIVIFPDFQSLAIYLLIAMAIGQNLIFWFGMRKASK